MPTSKETANQGVLKGLADRGEEALRLLSEELEKNPRAQQAKDRLGKLQRTTLHQLNIALADEVAELKKELARVEKRLAKLEKQAAGGEETHR